MARAVLVAGNGYGGIGHGWQQWNRGGESVRRVVVAWLEAAGRQHAAAGAVEGKMAAMLEGDEDRGSTGSRKARRAHQRSRCGWRKAEAVQLGSRGGGAVEQPSSGE